MCLFFTFLDLKLPVLPVNISIIRPICTHSVSQSQLLVVQTRPPSDFAQALLTTSIFLPFWKIFMIPSLADRVGIRFSRFEGFSRIMLLLIGWHKWCTTVLST